MTAIEPRSAPAWLHYLPFVGWIRDYRRAWLADDIKAGVTLAAYAIPISLALSRSKTIASLLMSKSADLKECPLS